MYFMRMRHSFKLNKGSFTRQDSIYVFTVARKILTDLQASGTFVYEDPELEQSVSQIVLKSGLDWVDCYLLYRARHAGYSIATRDKQLFNLLKSNLLSVFGGKSKSGISKMSLD